MPFVRVIFIALTTYEKDYWRADSAPANQNDPEQTKAFSGYVSLYQLLQEFIDAAQSACRVGIGIALFRFCVGQLTLVLTARNNLLAARRMQFKFNPILSEFAAFSFVGNQIACSLLGFVIVFVFVTMMMMGFLFRPLRVIIGYSLLGVLSIIIFSVADLIFK